MNTITKYYHSSIGKKQVVAVTGLVLILFIVGHLLGNLLIFGGPEMFNSYAKKLAGLRPGLYVVEFGLLFVFIVHMYTTALIVFENLGARGARYAVDRSKGKRSWATRTMSLSGIVLFAFVVWHLLDFTFIDHHGPRSILPNGVSYGLYGVVYNAFSNPVHSTLYVLAMVAVGLHLSHGIQSFFQTFGFNHPQYTPMIERISNSAGLFITILYSSIPIYVLIDCLKY